MSDVLEKLSAARNKFFRDNGYLPNVVQMNMADYRELGEMFDLNFMTGLKIEKRQGEMSCGYEVPEDDHITVEHVRNFSQWLQAL